jgi:NitT/TauT family transport system substrate-binding protein
LNRRRWLLTAAATAGAMLAACAPAAAPPPTARPATPAPPPAATSAAAPSSPAAAAPASGATAAARPELAVAPAVDLQVGTVPFATNAPFFVAQERGYFKEVGLNVAFSSFNSVTQQVPALAQGQLQVGSCASNAACFNALQRGTDIRIVADLVSAGKTARSTGSSGLAVRKDLWDDGTIREARDLVDRTVYLVPGPGGGDQPTVALWLRRSGVDPASVEWAGMGFPEQLAAMENHAIEVGIQTEPLLTVGLARGAHQVLATQEEMDPSAQLLYLAYWAGIERLGPQVGERFMVAYLRGARDYVNAFEYGVDRDAVIEILTPDTHQKHPPTNQQNKYTWDDPNGVVGQASLEARVDVFRDLGLITTPVYLGPAIDDRYRQFAVRYLGEYRPPR